MLSPVASSSGSFYALSNPLITAWKGFASHRFSLFSWQSAAIASLVITIAVLFENKRQSTRCQQLAKENDSLRQKQTDHQRQLDTANASTNIWKNLYINTTPSDTGERQKLITEVNDVVQATVKALGTLTTFLTEQIGQVPQTNRKESVELLKEIEAFRRFIAPPVSTEDSDEFVTVDYVSTQFLEKLSKFPAEIENIYRSTVSSLTKKEIERLENIKKCTQTVVNAIKQLHEKLQRLQTDKK